MEKLLKSEVLLELCQEVQRRQLPDRSITNDSISQVLRQSAAQQGQHGSAADIEESTDPPELRLVASWCQCGILKLTRPQSCI